ncbi:MAG: hypothetical protein ACN2B6_00925 [Rickettsiales bacterium]
MLSGYTKDQAKSYFDEKTKELGLAHTFDFDDAWDFVEAKKSLSDTSKEVSLEIKKFGSLSKEEFRSGISKIERKIRDLGVTDEAISAANPVKHRFGDGCYVREVFNPAGAYIVTKIHKKDHPFFLMKGEMTIFSEDGYRVVKAPHYGITRAGTKRFICAHTDCVFVTVHVTNKTNIDDIEKEVICGSFEEFDMVNV